jgi:inhibitor of KinA
MTGRDFPVFKPVADRAVLVEFGTTIADDIHARVLRLDRLVAAAPPFGLIEVVPAYASLLVVFDPVQTDHDQMTAALQDRMTGADLPTVDGRTHDIAVCYDADLGTDLAQIAAMTGQSPEAAIAAHLGGQYRVYLYGFAPGFAYLAGTPAALQLPRKPTAVRDVPAGRVIIAGPQCIVTTLTMPTGWWVVGASPDPILRDDPDRPFRFDVGDAVRFHRIDRAAYHAAGGA